MFNDSSVVMRRLPLAMMATAIFGALASNVASAVTLLVTDCTDGPFSGTLRNTIAAAPNNSVVEIPLMCSKITLDQGAIHILPSITNLYIVGQSPTDTIIEGSSHALPLKAGRLFESQQPGTLGFSQMTLESGHYFGSLNPRGGCVYSLGSVGLNNAVVNECSVNPDGGALSARGGGIYAGGSVALIHSQVTNNAVVGAPGATSQGGGIFAVLEIDATSSTIGGNRAISGPDGPVSNGGGFFSSGFGGNSLIKSSTISGNVADVNSAAELENAGSASLSIISSTIAYNYAFAFQTLGAYLHTTITDSTIAFNGAGQGGTSSPVGIYSPFQIQMYNSIFANNLARSGVSLDVTSNADGNKLIGSSNLITATANTPPPGTLTACPRLGHLTDNGGPTQTLPLLSGSPALDVGAANGQSTDQRGTGFPRTVGPGTDIGAYERQANAVDDEVFFGRFELRCD